MKNTSKVIIIFLILCFFVLLVSFFVTKYLRENINIDLDSINNRLSEEDDFSSSNTKDVDMEYITETLKVEESYIEKYIGKVPIIEISSSMYVVIKAKSLVQADNILSSLNDFGESYEEYWNGFLLSQQEYVKNRKIGKKGKYVYIIIDENAKELEEEIFK